MTSVVESMNVNEATTDDGDNESDERGTAPSLSSAPYVLPSLQTEGGAGSAVWAKLGREDGRDGDGCMDGTTAKNR